MPLPTSGQITMEQIKTEFGGSNPINLSDYYRNGSYVTSNNTNVPTSGQISLNNFYGAQKQLSYTYVSMTTRTYSNSSNAQQSITMPTGIQTGDLIIVIQRNSMGSQDGYGAGDPKGNGTGFRNVVNTFSNTPYNGSSNSSHPHPNNRDTYLYPHYVYTRNSSWYVWTNVYTISYKVASSSDSGASIGGFNAAYSYWANGGPGGSTISSTAVTCKADIHVLRPDYTVGSNYQNKVGGQAVTGLSTIGPNQMGLAAYQCPPNPSTGSNPDWIGSGGQGNMATPANGAPIGIVLHHTGNNQSTSTPSGMIPSNAISTLKEDYSSNGYNYGYTRTVIFTLPQSASSVAPTFPNISGSQSASFSLITTW
tara:strand:- start:506 stop:1600 length:1095 start_codon:yes stop_codon:yes gene_type:complete